MLYSEFVEGTGCKDTAKNYEVYKNLEVMYMNSDMSKEEIYEYGKKLVDNSKSAEQIQFEEELRAEIEEHRNVIKDLTKEIEERKAYLELETDKVWIQMWKREIKFRRQLVKQERNRIAELKWVIG